jgi:hypothetical protein
MWVHLNCTLGLSCLCARRWNPQKEEVNGFSLVLRRSLYLDPALIEKNPRVKSLD